MLINLSGADLASWAGTGQPATGRSLGQRLAERVALDTKLAPFRLPVVDGLWPTGTPRMGTFAKTRVQQRGKGNQVLMGHFLKLFNLSRKEIVSFINFLNCITFDLYYFLYVFAFRLFHLIERLFVNVHPFQTCSRMDCSQSLFLHCST